MPFKRPPDDQTIDCPDQIRALCSPMRHEIHQVVLSQGEASIREIAEQMGRKPASLYRHIDQLVEVGLLIDIGTKSTSRRDAKVYTTKLEFMRYRPRKPEMVKALGEFARASLKDTGQKITKAFDSGEAVLPIPHRDTFVGSPAGWLDEDELEELNTHIDAIIGLLADKPRKPGSKRMVISMGMYCAGEQEAE
ncbi:MAG: helix-turn-helix transcriptional regulator [Phycisphaerales bacterium]|nr:helix-turn-helix transcriptional regulator [Phycisphaerales bacterium]